jgi:hypothetical protein
MSSSSSESSSTFRRRKRAEPKQQLKHQPALVDIDVPHHTQQQPEIRTSNFITIAVCREAAIAAEATRIPDPPLTSVSPADVAAAVATRLRTPQGPLLWRTLHTLQLFLLPDSPDSDPTMPLTDWPSHARAEELACHLQLSTTKTSLPTAVFEALVALVATEGLGVLAVAWARAVAEETARAAAAATHHQQLAHIARQWNERSRPVGLLGSPGMGCGVNVLPYLHRSVEGRALRATSQEIGRACRLDSTCWVEVWRN